MQKQLAKKLQRSKLCIEKHKVKVEVLEKERDPIYVSKYSMHLVNYTTAQIWDHLEICLFSMEYNSS